MEKDNHNNGKEEQTKSRRRVGYCSPPDNGVKFKPGQSGNPNGRPRTKPMTNMLKAMLDKDDGAAMQAILKRAVTEAKKGDYRFAKEILDRSDGKVADHVEHSGRVDSLVTQEKFEDMDNDRKARFLRTAGVTDVLTPGDGADSGPVDAGEG